MEVGAPKTDLLTERERAAYFAIAFLGARASTGSLRNALGLKWRTEAERAIQSLRRQGFVTRSASGKLVCARGREVA